MTPERRALLEEWVQNHDGATEHLRHAIGELLAGIDRLTREVAEARAALAFSEDRRVDLVEHARQAEQLVVGMSKQCAEMERRLDEMERQRDEWRALVERRFDADA